MSDGIRGVVIGHSSLGEGMVAAVRRITGVDEDALSSLSNEGRGPDELLEAIRKRAGDNPVILFTDMGGGSCAFAARKAAMMRGSTAHVAGVNLPLLLDFVFHRELPLTELAERLVESGRAGITGMCTEETAHADHTAPD
jgi:mannose/fructose-specific phosphotransferase system component IIA